MKTKILSIILSVFGFALHASANEKIYVNREVTTHIVMPENINWWIFPPQRLSETNVLITLSVSNRLLRAIPLEHPAIRMTNYWYGDSDWRTTYCPIRHRIYRGNPICRFYLSCVLPTCGILYQSRSFHAGVGMARYAWAVYGSNRKYNQVVSRMHGMKAWSTISIPSVTISSLITRWRTRQR